MTGPTITVDLRRIEQNARVLVEASSAHGISVAGVSKSTCGSPKVARAMVRGGVTQIADSRLDNLARIRRDGITVPLMLIRAPSLNEIDDTIRYADISLNSELTTIAALGRAAQTRGVVHDIVLMIDLGDLREGILPAEALDVVAEILPIEGIRLIGIGANLACVGGIQPTVDNLSNLVYLADEITKRFSIELPIVSGGNTFSLPLLETGTMPEGINHLRLGASIVLAESPTPPGLYELLNNDAFTLTADIIEAKVKPSRPYGVSGEDAFGRRPVFDNEDKPSRRLILSIGREDISPEGLTPIDPRLKVISASSDHLLVDAGETGDEYRLGGTVDFTIDYGALLMAMTSPYVEKRYVLGTEPIDANASVELIDLETTGLASHLLDHGLREDMSGIGFDCVQGENAAADLTTLPLWLTAEAWQNTRIPIATEPGTDLGAIIFASHGDIEQLLSSAADLHGPSLENTVLVGVKNATVDHKRALDEYGVLLVTIDEIDRHGMAALMPRVLAAAGQGVNGVHVHFDMDIIDGRVLGVDDTTHLGGLTFREAHLAAEFISETGLTRSISIGSVAGADSDPLGRQATFVDGLVASLLGRKVVKA